MNDQTWLSMSRREFTRLLSIAGMGLAVRRISSRADSVLTGRGQPKHKYWAWLTTESELSDDDLKKLFAIMRESGVDAILPEIYNSRQAFYESKHLPISKPWLESVIPLAKAEGLEVHSWMWSMPCNIPEVIKEHHDWFMVNRNGESAADKPAYVDWYKFLCPSRLEVQEFVRATVAELSAIDGLDGVHLDYIRYPDVILADGLQTRYGIKQDREYPQYDYCYCDVCRHDFERETGIDPMKITDPSSDRTWRQFRYDRITHLVDDVLIPVAHANKKVVTAAVFPNWENVRQEWPKWKLDSVMPMLYAGFYNGDINWIKTQTLKGVESLQSKIPLYSGLMVSELKAEDLSRAVDASMESGANGVVLFSARDMTPEQWKAFGDKIKTEH